MSLEYHHPRTVTLGYTLEYALAHEVQKMLRLCRSPCGSELSAGRRLAHTISTRPADGPHNQQGIAQVCHKGSSLISLCGAFQQLPSTKKYR
jgi:hypothetical protein